MKPESREEFLRAAMIMFAEKGYHDTSVDDIAEKAGRSKGGFYYHFESKDQIVMEIFTQMLERTSARIHQCMQSGLSMKGALIKLIDEFEPVMKDRRQMLAGTDFFFLALHDEQLAKIVKSVHDKVIDLICEFLKQGIDRGEIRSNIDIREVAEIFFSSGRGIVWMYTILNKCGQIPKTLRYFIEIQFLALGETTELPV